MKLTDKKRQDIIDAALEEFREMGFSGAKTTRIAKKANVSSRTLYNHFESKEVLFQAVLEIIIVGKQKWESVDYDSSIDLKEQFTNIMQSYITVVTEPEALSVARMVNSEVLRDLDKAQSFFPKLEVHDYPLVKLISQAMDAGVLRKANPEYAASQLFALIRGKFFWPEMLLGEKQETKGTLKDCIQMFLAHYDSKKQN